MAKDIMVLKILTAVEHWYSGIGTLSDIGFELEVPVDSFAKVMVEQKLCTPDYHPGELVSEERFVHALLFILLLHERSARTNTKRQK